MHKKQKNRIIIRKKLKKYAYNINFYAQSPLQSFLNGIIMDSSNKKQDCKKCAEESRMCIRFEDEHFAVRMRRHSG